MSAAPPVPPGWASLPSTYGFKTGQLVSFSSGIGSGKSTILSEMWKQSGYGNYIGNIDLDLVGLDDDAIRVAVLNGLGDWFEEKKIPGVDAIHLVYAAENFLKHSGFLRRIKSVTLWQGGEDRNLRFTLCESVHSLLITLTPTKMIFNLCEGGRTVPINGKHKNIYAAGRNDPAHHQAWRAHELFKVLSASWRSKLPEWKKNLNVRLKPWE